MEQKNYYSIDEAAQLLNLNRATLYKWIDTLKIQKYRFSISKKTFLAANDVERLKDAKEQPWLVEKAKPIEEEEE